jgi:surface-anchored protein
MKLSFQGKQLTVFMASLLMLTWPAAAQDHDHDHGHAHEHEGGTALYLAEHGDFEVVFEEGELDLAYHMGAGAIIDGKALEEDTAFHPEDLIVVLTEEAEILRPAGEQWDASGVDANEPLWVIPQIEQEGVPALGLGFDIPVGVLLDDLVTLSLVAMAGPGDLSLWENNAFGQPTFLMSTQQGILESPFPNDLHAHYNWGFTAPGDYILVFEASGNLVEGGLVSTLAIYRFKVTDGPICLEALPGDVNGDCVVDEHDLHIAEENLGRSAPTWPGRRDQPHGHSH